MERILGIDLGTSNVSIYQKKKGKILQEPCVVAVDKSSKEILAYGKDAKRMYGKTPEKIELIHPMKEGVIADFEVTDQLIQYFFKKTKIHTGFMKPKIIMSIPLDVTKAEKSAFKEAGERMGSREVILVDGIKAAALGSGMDINLPKASMIIDMGYGKTDMAVLSLGEIIKGVSIPIAGEKIDSKLVSYLKQKYKLLIGEKTAEEVKIEATSLVGKKKEVEVRGRDLITNLPHTITIDSADITEAIQEEIYTLIDEIKNLLEDIHPEMAADIAKEGIILTGGSSSLTGLDELISYELGIPVHKIKDSESSTIEGIGIMLENIKSLENNSH